MEHLVFSFCRLHLKKVKSKKIKWTEDTIDNEGKISNNKRKGSQTFAFSCNWCSGAIS